jgi:hypothetical protein
MSATCLCIAKRHTFDMSGCAAAKFLAAIRMLAAFSTCPACSNISAASVSCEAPSSMAPHSCNRSDVPACSASCFPPRISPRRIVHRARPPIQASCSAASGFWQPEFCISKAWEAKRAYPNKALRAGWCAHFVHIAGVLSCLHQAELFALRCSHPNSGEIDSIHSSPLLFLYLLVVLTRCCMFPDHLQCRSMLLAEHWYALW